MNLTFIKANNLTAYVLIYGTNIGVVIQKDNIVDVNWYFRFLTSNISSFGNIAWTFNKRLNYIDQPNIVIKDVEKFLNTNSKYIIERIFE